MLIKHKLITKIHTHNHTVRIAAKYGIQPREISKNINFF